MIVGDVDEENLLDHREVEDIRELVRCTGSLEGRDFFAAYSAASIFLVPPASQASIREILEAMAMGCAVACFEQTPASSSSVVILDETGVILPAAEDSGTTEWTNRPVFTCSTLNPSSEYCRCSARLIVK